MASKTFKNALLKAGNTTYKTGHETVFAVFKQFASDDFGVPWVKEGGCADMISTPYDKDLYSVSTQRGIEIMTCGYPLFNIHYHPAFDEPIIPSVPDLMGVHKYFLHELNDEISYEVRTVSGIAQIDSRRNVELLFIQPLMSFCPGVGEEGIVEQLETIGSTKGVAKFLEDSGIYTADVMHFQKWELIEADLPKLEEYIIGMTYPIRCATCKIRVTVIIALGNSLELLN